MSYRFQARTLILGQKEVYGGSFSEAQIQVLLLTNPVTNSCGWKIAAITYSSNPSAPGH